MICYWAISIQRDMYDYEIAKMLGITMKQFNRQLRESLDRLEIK